MIIIDNVDKGTRRWNIKANIFDEIVEMYRCVWLYSNFILDFLDLKTSKNYVIKNINNISKVKKGINNVKTQFDLINLLQNLI